MWLVSVWSAVVVEWAFLNPCWCDMSGILLVMVGRMIFSNVLAIGERSDIGRKEEPICGSLLGLGMGIILAVFQIWGIVFVFRAMLYIVVR